MQQEREESRDPILARNDPRLPATDGRWIDVLTDGVVYEVTVEVDEHRRERFEEWFPNVVLDWTTQPAVRSFRVYRGVDDGGERLRFAFAFENEADWERFAQRGGHRERMAHLESLAGSVHTALWVPAAVSLHGDGPAIVRVDDSLEEDRLGGERPVIGGFEP